MRNKIEEILFPKKKGLINNKKPMVVILSSPWGGKDGPVRFKSAKALLDANGYRVLNKKEMYFTADSPDIKAINGKAKQEITIWLETHGAPGWLFGKEGSLKSENQCMLIFARFIEKLAKNSNCTIENIVLSGCNSATEYLDEDNYFNSPARLLSFLLPEINVLGFVGRNSSAKITSIWEMSNDILEECVLPLVEGSVLYKDNKVVENCSANLYCPVMEIPKFINVNFNFDAQQIYFPHVDVQFMLQKLEIHSPAHSYGQEQFESLIDMQTSVENSEKSSPKFFSPKTQVNSTDDNAPPALTIEERERDLLSEEDGLKSKKFM